MGTGRRLMRVRDEILVLRPANGGMDVPLVFEINLEERAVIYNYLLANVPSYGPRNDLVVPDSICVAACRLAERGMPDAITKLVKDELIRRGRWSHEVDKVEPFVVVGVK
jgi:hypothetical protein